MPSTSKESENPSGVGPGPAVLRNRVLVPRRGTAPGTSSTTPGANGTAPGRIGAASGARVVTPYAGGTAPGAGGTAPGASGAISTRAQPQTDKVYGNHKSPKRDSIFKCLEAHIDNSMDDHERQWVIGLQTGIGLGIICAREALLNEMQFKGTALGRKVDIDPLNIEDAEETRMKMGSACQTGFDLRVAQRAAALYKAHCVTVLSKVEDFGALPADGVPLMGTSVVLPKETSGHSMERPTQLQEMRETTRKRPRPSIEVGNDLTTGQQDAFTSSFLADGESIGGVDMTCLNGSAAVYAHILQSNHGYGSLQGAQGSGMAAESTFHPTGNGQFLGHFPGHFPGQFPGPFPGQNNIQIGNVNGGMTMSSDWRSANKAVHHANSATHHTHAAGNAAIPSANLGHNGLYAVQDAPAPKRRKHGKAARTTD